MWLIFFGVCIHIQHIYLLYEEMSKQKLLIWVIISLIFWCMYFTYAQVYEWDITLRITWLGIRHGTPENLSLWTITSSPGDQYISGHFTQPFWVEDIEGYMTGHYTTIQCAGVYGPNNTILTWVELMAGDTEPELLMGMTGTNVFINPMLHTYTSITEPVTYIYKTTDTNNIWIVNKYGDKPWLKILIPPTSPAGIYSGTIVFSFYMND